MRNSDEQSTFVAVHLPTSNLLENSCLLNSPAYRYARADATRNACVISHLVELYPIIIFRYPVHIDVAWIPIYLNRCLYSSAFICRTRRARRANYSRQWRCILKKPYRLLEYFSKKKSKEKKVGEKVQKQNIVFQLPTCLVR